ncbi:hypothetical protein B0T16DRAFT_395025 [Cercophora newfieldiana]|uniref:Uncharacterized protein n=1 Tax=Cercophora newfieldiana TaxID=92897 RepID=A0AA39XTA4_9PEZI|nr:hypothetical protein B0T16DRAFT_395025 [Cercophora newfieldiana]
MDVVYNQHSSSARRKNRSSTNLHHLSLAPLTTKLPLNEDGDLSDTFTAPASYLQGKSAPATPRLLSRSPGRSPAHSRSQGTSVPSSANRLPKSKSATHLPPTSASWQRSSQQLYHATSPTAKRRSHDPFIARDRTDSDWMLRAGALISTETRESKGQAWLISRASSTSLAGMHPEDDAFDRELALEREQYIPSRNGSRRHSRGPAPEDGGDHMSSPPYSRYGSRSHSRVGSRSQMMTPLELRSAEDGYFPATSEYDAYISGPDFVNLDEALEAVDEEVDTIIEDEAYVRRLVKKGNGGMGSWFGSVLGVQLFSVEENSDESDDGDGDSTEGELDEAEGQPRRSSSNRRLDGMMTELDARVPPPKAEEGGWHDAAWLLTVASKVIL